MTSSMPDLPSVPPASDITLSEEGGVRYLHFGSPWVQGAMRIRRPFDIELDYVQRMMAWLLFLSPPPRLLQLGLGAGALTKFSHRRLPATRTVAIERDPAVIDAARRWFRLPEDDERLQVRCADAGEFVRRPARPGEAFGVIQVDLYDSEARGPVLDSEAFYRDCRTQLDDVGILVVNLFGSGPAYRPGLQRLRDAFDDRVLALAPVPAGNVVCLAFQGPPIDVTFGQVQRRASQVARRFGLPARQWLAGWTRDDPNDRLTI